MNEYYLDGQGLTRTFYKVAGGKVFQWKHGEGGGVPHWHERKEGLVRSKLELFVRGSEDDFLRKLAQMDDSDQAIVQVNAM